ncbi:hypothetical protein IAU60_005704 [Kwoniella sp. DSM 27419]
MNEHELSGLDAELRAIRLDEGPRLVPLRLDQLEDRTRRWHAANPTISSRSEAVYRPPSPPRESRIYPLPLKTDGVSPLAGLFQMPELVPLILDSFDKPRDLAKICRVSREWCHIGRRRLYEHVWIRPWEDGCRRKIKLLFENLQQEPELCEMVKRLDVRFFPLATRGEERTQLDDQVQAAVGGMQRLESLVWTRDRSLNPAFFENITGLRHLRSLEISGHSYRYYDPSLIGVMPALTDLRIMMPDMNLKSKVAHITRDLSARPNGGLRGLGIICQNSSLIDDAVLKMIAPDLSYLRRLTLWGCSRVTRDGVHEILREAASEVEELSLDAVPHSGLLDLSVAPDLPRLHTLSLLITVPHHDPAYPILVPKDLPRLSLYPSLTSLHLTLSGAHLLLPLPSYQHLQAQLPQSLKKLSLINMVIASETLAAIITSNTALEELYISVNHRSTVLDCETLVGQGQNLRILHVNGPEEWGPNADDLRVLAERLRGLEEVGSGNRVYEVHRYLDEDGMSRTELSKWGKTYIPGYFTVWRA